MPAVWLTILNLAFLLTVWAPFALAADALFPNAKICKAGLSVAIGKNPDTIKINETRGDITILAFTHPNGGNKKIYRCKLSDDRVVWASGDGRWRNSQYDTQITYVIEGEMIQIVSGISAVSATRKSFAPHQLD